jgi:hypothetical protein
VAKAIPWKKGKLVSVGLRDGSRVLGQMLERPYLVFFDAFTEPGPESELWDADRAGAAEPLAWVAVTGQFRSDGDLRAVPKLSRPVPQPYPTEWIKPFPGSRKATVWPGTEHERSFIIIGNPPGGQLIRQYIDQVGIADDVVVMKSIPLDDDTTINGHELSVSWTFPLLNERLYLCKVFGRSVDPLKDLKFDRKLPLEYLAFIDLTSRHGSAADWGYPSPD